MDRRYDNADGPPRDARHSLERWHAEADREEAQLSAAERLAAASLPDVYQVADRVLAPLLERLRAVPRRLRAAAMEALERRGERCTRQNLLLEAARMLAQERAAKDPEFALALLLRAALLFRPEGGWSRRGPYRPPREGFSSIGDLLSAAFSEIALGAGAIPLEVAQNRARTRSREDEVFVQASHTGTANTRNAARVERRTDAQALILRSEVDLRLLPLLLERHVLGRYATRAELLDELRAREAKRRRRPCTLTNVDDPTDVREGTVPAAELPPRPSDDAPEAAWTAWRLAVGIALWGEHPKQLQHVRRQDRALVRPIEEAELALQLAIGRPPKPPRRSAQRSREIPRGA